MRATSGGRARSRLRAAFAGVLAVASALAMAGLSTPAPAEAISGSEFDPRYIISDSQFYDTDAMSEAEIQTFLVNMVGYCSNSNCLADYRQTTYSRAADRTVCGPYTGASNERASTIIFKVQQACGISAKVLLVTLQKEQGLLTNHAPSDSRLGRAMGYACPDSAGGACDAQFYGFYNQMYKAAWQFKRYSTPDQWGTYYPGPPLPIAFHPNGACGSVGIAIRNNATAALYNYTPYVPNAAALANLGSTGDACSSYGNRNFWYYYYSWFGNPTGVVPAITSISRISGVDRYDTSAKITVALNTTSANTVYIASGVNFPDALSASPAAILTKSPLMLTAPTSLPDPVRTQLVRLHPQKIIVLGGEDSVSADVYAQLTGLAPSIERLTGADRYATSRLIAETTFTAGSTLAYISTGEGFPDALAASTAAGKQSAPVILVPGSASTVDDATIATLAELGVNHVIVTGSTSTVSAGIETRLRAIPGMTVERLTGNSRYATASAINRDVFTSTTSVVLASGVNFPDALSGATLAASLNAPLYLSGPSCMTRQTAQDMVDLKATKMVILGGTDSLSSAVEAFLNCE